LDEVREADILLHVVDISHPSFEEQIEIVNQTLTEIKAADKPTILVFNKIDAYHPKAAAFDEVIETPEGEVIVEQTKEMVLDKLKKSYLTGKSDHVVFISAQNKENLEELRNTLFELVKGKHFQIYPNWVNMNFSDGMPSNFDIAE
jgi:GTP-binding protein HflX